RDRVVFSAKTPLPSLGLHVGHVVGVCPREQVRRVATRRVVAVMTDHQAIRNRTERNDPGGNVCPHHSGGRTVLGDSPMSRTLLSPSHPDPAWTEIGAYDRAVLVDLRPESIRQRTSFLTPRQWTTPGESFLRAGTSSRRRAM